VDEVRELNCILDEEDGNVVADYVKVAFVGISDHLMLSIRRVNAAEWKTEAHSLVANPWTSRAVSALPRDPATVEKRTNTGVCLPFFPKNEAAVMLLKSS
jgi:hypothetical protein